MKLIRLLAAVLAGGATLVLTLVLLRRRPGRLRLDRGRAALGLAARGGARYAASAPRLFTAAGERRQLLREDLALRTAQDVADPEAFRATLENAGFLRPGAPLSTQEIVEHLAVFYDTIREPGPLTITSDYASSVVRRFFDLRSPVAPYISVPQSYVILQRINLGLFAVLGELSATADWRAIAEEIWPFVHGPAATPMGEAEAAWQARHQAMAA
jgi:hypothetical protein